MAIRGDNTLESSFRQWLDKQFTQRGWFFQSIETTTQAGVPDAYVHTPSKTGWYELKKGNTALPLIRKEQRVWHLKHHNAGGYSLLLYYRYDLDEVWIYQPPFNTVSKSGRYLALHDSPILKVSRHDLLDTL